MNWIGLYVLGVGCAHTANDMRDPTSMVADNRPTMQARFNIARFPSQEQFHALPGPKSPKQHEATLFLVPARRLRAGQREDISSHPPLKRRPARQNLSCDRTRRVCGGT